MQDEFLRLQDTLRKTIVFITHDFDEAIRLADRIAIMKDGRIEQIGTPEDLVIRPATAYVAEFTRDVPAGQGPDGRRDHVAGEGCARRGHRAGGRAHRFGCRAAPRRHARRSRWSTPRACASAHVTREAVADVMMRG